MGKHILNSLVMYCFEWCLLLDVLFLAVILSDFLLLKYRRKIGWSYCLLSLNTICSHMGCLEVVGGTHVVASALLLHLLSKDTYVSDIAIVFVYDPSLYCICYRVQQNVSMYLSSWKPIKTIEVNPKRQCSFISISH